MHRSFSALHPHYGQEAYHLQPDDEQFLVCRLETVPCKLSVPRQMIHFLLHHTLPTLLIHHMPLILKEFDQQLSDKLLLEFRLDFVEFEAISNVRIRNRLKLRSIQYFFYQTQLTCPEMQLILLDTQ